MSETEDILATAAAWSAEGEQVAIAKDAGKLPSNKQSAWQWQAISSLVQ